MTLGVVDTGLAGTSGSGYDFDLSISDLLVASTGVFIDSSTFVVKRGLPQRTQYFLIGLFAFPQLAQVLTDH